MGACTECRAAKVKCDQVFPCSRCRRLGRNCVKHESRQGQGRGKKKRKPLFDDDDIATATSATQRSASEDAGISGVLLERGCVEAAAGGDGAGGPAVICSNHFGLNYLIRSWVSIAFRRRSFSLLSRAGGLASRIGISMDQILCETESRRGMDFLYPILLTETSKQDVIDGRLDPSKIPGSLWKAMESRHDAPLHRENRWIWARETFKGISRFYCSPGFERNVSTLSQMEDTYRSNEKSVIDLFMVDRCAQVRGIAHQVAHNKSRGADLKPYRQKGVMIRTAGAEEPVKVDQVLCFAISSLDHGFFMVEYIPPKETRAIELVPSAVEETSADVEVAAAASDLENFDTLELGDFDNDDEMKMIYELLSG